MRPQQGSTRSGTRRWTALTLRSGPQLDRRLMRAERAFLDPDGLPGRPWYRHAIFAPQYSYAPEVLPAVVEAIRTGDPGRVSAALDRLTLAIRRAVDALDGR